jgi:hypothetical protein
MEAYFDNTIDNFLKLTDKICPNYTNIDLARFVLDNNIDFNNIIEIIENKNFDIKDHFIERIDLQTNSKQKESCTESEKQTLSKLFLIFIDYCYYLQIQEKKNIKDFIMPSNDAFEYKMNNDIRPAKNKTYTADVLMHY